MKKTVLFLSTMLWLALSGMTASAQSLNENALLYHSLRSPISTQLNPALFPNNSRWYVTLPHFEAGFGLPMSYKDLGLEYDAARDVTVLDLNHLLDVLEQNGNNISISSNIELLGFGFKVADKLHFFASTGLRVSSNINVPFNDLKLLTEGNSGENHSLVIGDARVFDAQTYLHVSGGAAYDFSVIPLTVGARANLLIGAEIVSAENMTINLTTAADNSSLTATSDYLMRMAGLAYLKERTDDSQNPFDFDYTLGMPGNLGFTFDLGAKYSFKGFDFSFSLLDVGPGIHWKDNPMILTPKNKDASITFDGLELSSVISGGELDTSFISNLKDSLFNMIDYESEAGDFWYGVPTRIYLGASYTLFDLIRVGYLFHGEWSKGVFYGNNNFRCNNTLSAHLSLFDWFELSLANSLTFDGGKSSFFNPGISASLNLGKVFQLYAGVDYVSSLYATDIKSARVFFGASLVGFAPKKLKL